MSLRRSLVLARYALVGNLRTPYTRVGALLMVALALLGLYASARNGAGWVIDPSLLIDGALLGAVFGVRSGLISQRTGGLQAFLRLNFMSPLEHMAGAALSLLGVWLLVCAGVALLSLVLPGGGPAEAAWNATVFALRTGALLPFVLVAESISDIQLPFFLPGIAYVGLLMGLAITVGEAQATAILAPPMTAGDFGSTAPAVLRVAAVMPAGMGIVLGATWVRGRRG